MIKCGNCGNFHETTDDVKACSGGDKSVKTISGGRNRQPWKPNPTKIVNVSCIRRACDKKSGPIAVADAIGWACDEHANNTTIDMPAIGERVIYNEKQFEVLEIGNDHKTIRIRTGGQGKVVSIDEIARIPA